MAKSKSMGADEALLQPKQTVSAKVKTKRVINAGEEVVLSIGTYVVKEMRGADFLAFLLEAVDAIQIIFSESDGGFDALKKALRDPETLGKLNQFFALSMGKRDLDLSELTISDYLVLLSTCKQVYDWETISANFTELGLDKVLQPFLSLTTSQETT